MFCSKCQKDVSECTCPDIHERLKSLAQSGALIYRKCAICDKHYALCKCEHPVWITTKGD